MGTRRRAVRAAPPSTNMVVARRLERVFALALVVITQLTPLPARSPPYFITPTEDHRELSIRGLLNRSESLLEPTFLSLLATRLTQSSLFRAPTTLIA